MSVLDALDATRVCSRWSQPLADPTVWTLQTPTVARSTTAETPAAYSWVALARNPHAMLVTGMVGTLMAKDAALRLLGSRG